MGFRDEVSAGIAQEFQIYRHQIFKLFLIFGLVALRLVSSCIASI